MLENAWEGHATTLANAPDTDAFIAAVEHMISATKIDSSKPSRVVYARDTRPSGLSLVRALEDGLNGVGTQTRNAGVTTTPILHYFVRAINTKGSKDEYGPDSEEGYVTKLTAAFKKLIVGGSTSRTTCHSPPYRPEKLLYRPWSSIVQMGLAHSRCRSLYLSSVIALRSSR